MRVVFSPRTAVVLVLMLALALPFVNCKGTCVTRFSKGKMKQYGDCGQTADVSAIMKGLSKRTDEERESKCYMGMKSGLIPDSRISASTEYASVLAAHEGRLDNQLVPGKSGGAWAAKKTSPTRKDWLGVDFGSVKSVAGVITQGNPKKAIYQRVTAFKVKYKEAENSTFKTIQVEGVDKVFDGNKDADSKVFNRFPEVIRCRYIRIYPHTCSAKWCSMRLEIVSGACFNDTVLWGASPP